jgi:hypothetical protein
MAPWDYGFVSARNYSEQRDYSHLPAMCDLWREMLGYVVCRQKDWFGDWEFIYKWVRLICRKVGLYGRFTFILPWRVLRLAHARGRHWDRKRK